MEKLKKWNIIKNKKKEKKNKIKPKNKIILYILYNQM